MNKLEVEKIVAFLGNTIQYGDLIATRSNGFLSKAIRWFMRKETPNAPDFSHIAVVINIWGEIWIAEALSWGVRVWPLENSGYDVNKEIIILRDKRGFTDVQIEVMSRQMVSLSGIRYQYSNLFQWAARILFKIRGFFKKDNANAIYCSELGAIAINSVYPGSFARPNITSPVDHLTSGLYDIIDPYNILVK